LLVSALVLVLLVLLPAVWGYAAVRGWVEPFETGAPGIRPPLGRDGRPVPIEQLPNVARAGVMIGVALTAFLVIFPFPALFAAVQSVRGRFDEGGARMMVIFAGLIAGAVHWVIPVFGTLGNMVMLGWFAFTLSPIWASSPRAAVRRRRRLGLSGV
jgi:hypothetical protein